MRLTNFHRAAIVSAAMQDVPTVDYIEQLRTLINQKVQALQKAHKMDLVEPARLYSACIYLAGQSFASLGLLDAERNMIKNSPDVVALLNAKHEQDARIADLKNSLRNALLGCSSLKQAKQALPEFEKYFPSETPGISRSVPMIANVLSDFVKAGWPKQNARIIPAATPKAQTKTKAKPVKKVAVAA